MPDVQDERERTLHDLAVPEMVRLVRRVFPSLLLVVPDLGAQFLGVLFKLPAVIGVEVERAGVIRVDAELERQIGLEERHVAAVQHQPAGDLDLVALGVGEILLMRGGVGLRHRADALPREDAAPMMDGPSVDLGGAPAHRVDHGCLDRVFPAVRVGVDAPEQDFLQPREVVRRAGRHEPALLGFAIAVGPDDVPEIVLLRVHRGQKDGYPLFSVHRAGNLPARAVVAQGEDGVFRTGRVRLHPRLGGVLVPEVLEVVQFSALLVFEPCVGHFGHAHKV